MNYFLAKTHPETYSVDDLEREKKTVWNGVRNPQAVRAIKEMKVGDKIFVYHSGGKSEIVGLMKVVSVPRPDPKEIKSWVVDVEFIRKFKEPVGLKEIKETELFDDWSLVRQGRLSTMSVPEKFVKWMGQKNNKYIA